MPDTVTATVTPYGGYGSPYGGPPAPVSAPSTDFMVHFSTPTYGVDFFDFNVYPQSGSAYGSVERVTSYSSQDYLVTVGGLNGTGSLGLGFSNYASFYDAPPNIDGVTSSPVYVQLTSSTAQAIDRDAPFATSTAVNEASNLDHPAFNVHFSEQVVNVDYHDFAVFGTGGTAATVDGVSTSNGQDYTVYLGNVTGTGSLTLALSSGATISDLAGNGVNPSMTSSSPHPIDRDAPTATSTAEQGSSSDTTAFFDVHFSEPVNSQTVNASDFKVVGTDTASGTIQYVSPTGLTYINGQDFRVQVGGITGAGSLSLALDSNARISDVAGNEVNAYAGFSSSSAHTVGYTPSAATHFGIIGLGPIPDGPPGFMQFSVQALDANNNVVPDFTGTVSFAVFNPEDAIAPPVYSFTSDDQGSHLFYARFNDPNHVAFAVNDTSGPTSGSYDSNAPCYCTGTRILTDRGEVAVEDLRIGDLVITASGERRPIRWIGQRTVNCRAAREPAEVRPVRLAMGALAPSLPRRDLLVSPDHAFFFDDVIVPAKALINGSTVQQVEAEVVTYFAIELDSHDMILAEGVASETYLDDGQRDRFDNYAGDGSDLDRTKAFSRAGSYRPLHLDGPRVGQIRAWIDARARQLGRPAVYGLAEVQTVDTAGAAGATGHLDAATREWVEGWAWYPDQVDELVLLELVLDGEVRAVFAADVYRPDLAFMGSGRHAFRLRLPPEAHGERWTNVGVRVRGTGEHLPNSPVLLASEQLLAA